LSREAIQQSRSAIYLPLREIVEMGLSILTGLDEMELVVMDDLETIAGQREWEELLFGLYNQIRDSNSHIVVAANASDVDTISGSDRYAFGYVLYRLFSQFLAKRLRLTTERLIKETDDGVDLAFEWK